MEDKLKPERLECGCNGISCNYQYQAVDVVENQETGETNIERAILFCTHCTHVEEVILSSSKAQIPQNKENAIQTS